MSAGTVKGASARSVAGSGRFGPRRNVVAEVLDEYGTYLRVQRRLAPLTAVTRTGVVGRFLRARGRADDLRLDALTVADLHAFVLAEADRLAVSSTRTVIDALRCFLRFLFATGVTAGDLSGTLPGVAGPRTRGLPRAVDAATVRALLDSCDRHRPCGLRDLAILTLQVRLGLRSSEVAALVLEDVDWRAGELLVHGKGGSDERLPLPGDVGDALAGYLHRGRPSSPSRAVFLSALPPFGPLSRNGVVFVPRTASVRAGVPVVGAHRLRHTAATGMLRAGASLRDVGQVLRHYGDEQTTAVYATVDHSSLRLVVRNWPGTAR